MASEGLTAEEERNIVLHDHPAVAEGDPYSEEPDVEEADEPAQRNALMAFLIAEDWSDGTLMGLKDDLLAGVTLSMTQVAPALTFAIMAKMNPIKGLYTSFFLGVICAIFGGKAGMISAAAGATAVVFPDVTSHSDPLHPGLGEEMGHGATIIAGAFMVAPGLFCVAKYIRLLPASIMIGFVNGLAVLLAKGQLPAFEDENDKYVTGLRAFYTALLVIIGFAIMFLLPLVTKVVPSTFVAIVVGTAIEHIFQMGTVTIGDKHEVSGEFPSPKVPNMDFGDQKLAEEVCITALIVAVIGMVESLMTVHVMNVLTQKRGNFERESIAIGIGNVVVGFFRGFAGCAVIGPCILNFASGGGRRRVSAFLTGIMMMIIFLAAYKVINWIPMGVLSAVLFGIVVKTFDWRTWQMIFMLRIPLADSFIILVTTFVTIFTDLAIGVAAGLGAAFLLFIWDMRSRVSVPPPFKYADNSALKNCDGKPIPLVFEVYRPRGVLFFASGSHFEHQVFKHHFPKKDKDGNEIRPDDFGRTTDVVLDFGHGQCVVQDFSAADMLQEIGSQMSRSGKRLHVRNLDHCSEKLLWSARAYCPDMYFDSKDDSDAVVGRCYIAKHAPKKDEDGEIDVAADDGNTFADDVTSNWKKEQRALVKGLTVGRFVPCQGPSLAPGRAEAGDKERCIYVPQFYRLEEVLFHDPDADDASGMVSSQLIKALLYQPSSSGDAQGGPPKTLKHIKYRGAAGIDLSRGDKKFLTEELQRAVDRHTTSEPVPM